MTDHPNPVLQFMLTRRSRPAKLLRAPGPDRAALEQMLQAAARVPDHGKLEPWRFIVLEHPAGARVAGTIMDYAQSKGLDGEKPARAFADSPLCVAVIASPKPSEKIPELEQTLSVGAVCLGLVNAALATGWGANWLTGWPAHDHALMVQVLGLAPQEWVAGFIHMGTAEATPPDRPRPDMSAITEWVHA
ncbi:MAG: nitroreductase [Alphaproteobacteria bacterium]|jgi:nitroreductase|nr:nitroreductase [Alphaproteobacteria bacterium]